MKWFFFLAVTSLFGCASSPWNTQSSKDEFTDSYSCKVVYGTDFQKSFAKSTGGIHYYPFVEKNTDGVIFGIHNDYNIPVGNVQIRVDQNEYVEISTSDTPIKYAAQSENIDMSYLNGTNGIDTQALQKSMNQTMANVQKMSSPYTAVSGEKAQKIIEQLRNGSVMKMRIMGFGINATKSTTGEYPLGDDFKLALSKCGI